jgi:hypothetical protein
MAHEKNKVVVWRPFPSPTPREITPPMRAVSNILSRPKDESQSSKDKAVVERWIELADVLNGKKAKKKASAA